MSLVFISFQTRDRSKPLKFQKLEEIWQHQQQQHELRNGQVAFHAADRLLRPPRNALLAFVTDMRDGKRQRRRWYKRRKERFRVDDEAEGGVRQARGEHGWWDGGCRGAGFL
jgi:hypothetical protein